MKEEFKIAWRNLWRNKRRTIITAASIFFAVFFAVVMRSYQLGSYDRMINNFIESFTGYIQVQDSKYQNTPVIDNSFGYDDTLAAAISANRNVVSVTPHLESFMLASNGTQTKGVAIIGIDPEKEKKFSDPEGRLVKYKISQKSIQQLELNHHLPDNILKLLTQNIGRSYPNALRLITELEMPVEEIKPYLPAILKNIAIKNQYLTQDDQGILVSNNLANYLNIAAGDSVILMGQGYHGVSATGIFPVRGIIRMPSPEIDNKLIVMTIPAAQNLFDAEGKVTSLVVNLTDKSHRTITRAKKNINALLRGSGSEAKTWYELNPILFQQIQGDSQTGMVMLGLLYFIIFFGIFGTVLMMVSERRKEFGVLVSIGMQKSKLKRIVFIEMLLLGAMGVLTGLMASSPLILYFYYHPIRLTGDLAAMMEDYGWEPVMPTAWFGAYFYWQTIIVAVMVMLSTIYPLRKITTLKEIEALKA